jgi:hypothetical protein
VLGSAAGLSLIQGGTADQRAPEPSTGRRGLESAHIATEKTVRLSLVNESGKDTLYLGPAGDASGTSYKIVREQGDMLLLDNEPWQCGREGEVLIPIGEHVLRSAKLERGLADRFGLGLWVKDVTAEVGSVSRTPLGIAIGYISPRRAWAVLTREPKAVYVDGKEAGETAVGRYGNEFLVQLPSGKHKVEINDETTASVVVDVASAVSAKSVVWVGGKFVLLLVILYVGVRARRLVLAVGAKLGRILH